MATMPRLAILVATAAVLGGTATSARAWDPSTTHVGMTERAVMGGVVHRRWMESSSGRLGWFTGLRVDPKTLDETTARLLARAQYRGHADAGGHVRGGPGACPGPKAPPETLRHCVDGDLWEGTALDWLRLGIALEGLDAQNLLRHFVDPQTPGAPRWRAQGLGRVAARRIERRAGGSISSWVGGAGFAGEGMSALGWLENATGSLSPRETYRHLQQASFAATAAQRQHHLALGLMGVGALVHVTQDLTFPAYARGDLTAMFMPLSADRSDRGSQLGELSRLWFGRFDLPEALRLHPRQDAPGPQTLHELWLGSQTWQGDGLVPFTASRFLSEGRMPATTVCADALTAEAAATKLLGTDTGLDAVELTGATLAPWPASAGYVLSSSGRALAAWTRNDDDVVSVYLDQRVMRDQARALIPLAVAASQTLLDLLWPQWPEDSFDAEANVYEVEPLHSVRDQVLSVLTEDGAGTRTLLRRVALLPDQRSRVRALVPETLGESSQIILVLEGRRDDGQLVVIERRLPGTQPASPGPIEPAAVLK